MRIFPSAAPVFQRYISYNHRSVHAAAFHSPELTVYSAARAAGHYESTLLEAIHRFKYNGRTSIGEILGKLMAEFTCPTFNIGDYSLIMPVPLHSKRLRERGFNQSVILAREISKRFHISLDFMTLRRHAYTEPQISLGKKDREANVHGFFPSQILLKSRDKRSSSWMMCIHPGVR